MRRDLGEAVHRQLSQALRDSIDYAYAHVDEALEYAMRYGRGIDKETCRRFVLMYVNDYTKRLGDDGAAALERLYALAHAKRPDPGRFPPVDPDLSLPSRPPPSVRSVRISYSVSRWAGVKPASRISVTISSTVVLLT